MRLCKERGHEIVHRSWACPLCQLSEHNDNVHDFIEALGITKLLVYWQSNGKLPDNCESIGILLKHNPSE